MVDKVICLSSLIPLMGTKERNQLLYHVDYGWVLMVTMKTEMLEGRGLWSAAIALLAFESEFDGLP